MEDPLKIVSVSATTTPEGAVVVFVVDDHGNMWNYHQGTRHYTLCPPLPEKKEKP